MLKFWKTVATVLVLVTSTLAQAVPVSAGTPPTIKVGHWNFGGDCADAIYGPMSMEDYTWKTLANEMYDSWDIDSLKAFAVIIRSDAYSRRNATYTSVCPGTTGTFQINTAEQNYVHSTSAVDFPNSYSATNYTRGEALTPDQWYFYGICQQNVAADLADMGMYYRNIITDSSQGIFSTSQVNYCISQGDDWISPYSGLSFLIRW